MTLSVIIAKVAKDPGSYITYPEDLATSLSQAPQLTPPAFTLYLAWLFSGIDTVYRVTSNLALFSMVCNFLVPPLSFMPCSPRSEYMRRYIESWNGFSR